MPWRQALTDDHHKRREKKLWRSRQQLESPQAIEVSRNGKRCINFCSNDYLGLASHPELIQASTLAVQKWGVGSGASHLVCGHQTSHHQLELELAEFVGAEKAIFFSTGYMANLAIPQSFLRRGDLLLQDKLNHASLIDSAGLCRAEFKRYRHNDLQHAQDLLDNSQAERKLISTDAVFSMDGDQAPLAKLGTLAEKFSTVLLIDDAHGFGVLGQRGSGSYEAANLKPNEHRLMLGTLGKAAGSFGAFVAGDTPYIEHLEQYARTYIYTTALPAPVAEASRAALRIIQRENWRREKLSELINLFRPGIEQLGLDLMESSTPIQPIILGDESRALQASKILEGRNIWVSAIRPPTVPAGSARLRITLSAAHEKNHLNALFEGLKEIKERLF